MKLPKIIWRSIPFLFLGFCAVMVARCAYPVIRPPEIAEGLASVDWLPVEATDVNYCRSYGFTAFEFKISEAGFREWAATAAYPPRSEYVKYQPVTDVSELEEDRFFRIRRYNSYDAGGPVRPKDYEEHLRATTIEIKNGLWGEMRLASAGGYSIGYDRDTGTAYWQWNPR